MTWIKTQTDKGPLAVRGEIISQTGECLALTKTELHGGGFHWSITHVPTGFLIRHQVESKKLGSRFARGLYRALTKTEKERFKSLSAANINSLGSTEAMQWFLRRPK